jgi:hypothetical protein
MQSQPIPSKAAEVVVAVPCQVKGVAVVAVAAMVTVEQMVTVQSRAFEQN